MAVFCVGSVLDNGLKFGIHVMNNCNSYHILNIIQPLAQAFFMLFELYFIFNNTKVTPFVYQRFVCTCQFYMYLYAPYV